MPVAEGFWPDFFSKPWLSQGWVFREKKFSDSRHKLQGIARYF